MLLSAPIGTKKGNELRQEAHFSYHASTTPFIMAAQAVWQDRQRCTQPDQLQEQAQPQQPAQLQETAQLQTKPSTSKATQEAEVNEAPPTA
jgi:hypothetical protein